MIESVGEADIALLDVMHVNPRVSFEELGRVLDVSAVTAARRWRRLVDEGRAWVSSAGGPRMPFSLGLFEAECVPGEAEAVAAGLAAMPQVFSVHLTTGRYNVYGFVVAIDHAMLAHLLVDVLPVLPGLRSVRTAYVSRFLSGTRWRLGGLSASQARSVYPEPDSSKPGAGHVLDELDRQLYMALQVDGRLGFRDLAAQVGRSETMVRRRVGILTDTGLMAFRTDFARVDAGWPISVVFDLVVGSGGDAATVGRTLVGWPETRVCATIAGGAANLLVTAQLHEIGTVEALTSRIYQQFSGVGVVDTRVVLRPVKAFGRLLGSDGRACGSVPVDPWRPVG